MSSKYENPLCKRYAGKEMQRIFSEDNKFSTWRRLWLALAESERELGLPISEEQIEEMKAHLHDINYEVARKKELEVRHDVMAHIYAYGEQCPTAKPIIHLGATSCYVGDNTNIILIKSALLLIKKLIINTLAKLYKFAECYKDLPCLSYTHFQAAQPTTVGKRATLWMNDLLLDLDQLNFTLDNLKLLGCKGTTGTAVYSKDELECWVRYALEREAVILFDSAYESFIQDKNLPTSIYQIERSKECAIEFCSLSKTAGFTGTRCGYTVIPKELIRDDTPLNKLWLRRQTTKFNGVSYIIQRGAEAVFSDIGLSQAKENIAYYMKNAQIISDTLRSLGIWFTGGKNAPYIWLKCPNNMSSWEFFDFLLKEAGVVGTPGAGFGNNGREFFRFTAFGDSEDVQSAMRRLLKINL